MNDPIEQFSTAITAAGLPGPDGIIPDGKIHRFSTNGKRGDDSGWYMLHIDGLAAGAFGCWRSGLQSNWCAKADTAMTPTEREAYRARIKAMQVQRETEQAQRHTSAAANAAQRWQTATACTEHPYLTAKGVQAHGVRIDDTGSLIVPMRDTAGTLHSLQTITAEGDKRFLSGGKVKGCYHAIGRPDGVLIVCEGYATGASIHEATGHAVAVAFNAGNLGTVAVALRAKYPDLKIIMAADDDWQTEGNPGVSKASAAAQAVGGLVAVPMFPADRPDHLTDFNDLHQLAGVEAVRTCIENAQPGHASVPVDFTDRSAPSANESDPSESLLDAVVRLSKLHVLEYEQVRETEAKRLEVRVGVLDKEVSISRRAKQEEGGKAAMFQLVEMWPDPVEGAQLMNELLATMQRFIVCERETAIAAVLWCVFTWLVDSVQVAPLAVITAPEKRCGKSQLLSLIGKLSRRPLVASNISSSAMYRVIEAHSPTLLIDEADSFFKENEELRGVINSGHTRQSAYVIRNVGDDHEPRQFSTWGAKAISGIGHLSETIMDRAVILELRRKLSSENVQRLRHAEPGLFEQLASKLARFADDAAPAIERARPVLPDALNDRAQDNWEPLLAIADYAGGEWATLARNTALKLSGIEQEAVSLSAELLADIQEVFDCKAVDRLATADLLKALTEDDLKPWATYNRGKPMSPRQLAKRLGEYGIGSKTLRIGYGTPKGYELNQFSDTFTRYLAKNTLLSATPPQANNHAGFGVSDDPQQSAPATRSETRKPNIHAGCGGVADKTPIFGGDVVEVDV